MFVVIDWLPRTSTYNIHIQSYKNESKVNLHQFNLNIGTKNPYRAYINTPGGTFGSDLECRAAAESYKISITVIRSRHDERYYTLRHMELLSQRSARISIVHRNDSGN